MWELLLVFILHAHALEIHGTARSLSDNSPLYTEVHEITLDERGLNKKIQTHYKTPDGKVFAKMTSDFSKSDTVPVVHFEDYRFKKNERLEFIEDQKSWKFSLLGEKIEEKLFPLSQELVAGQGFDNFIKLNFEKLRKSELPLKFGVLSEMDFFSFRGYEKKYTNQNIVRFGIELKNIFLRFFADELLLEYDPLNKRILSYKGLSNILGDDGKSQNVFIEYKTVKP